MKKLSSLLLCIFFWGLALYILIVALNGQTPTPVAVDIQILEQHQYALPTCDNYKGLMVGQTLDVASAMLGVKTLKSTKIHDFIPVGKNIILYVFKGIVWRYEIKGVKLPCLYSYNYSGDNMKYRCDDIVVIYEDNKSYVTDLHLYRRVITGD